MIGFRFRYILQIGFRFIYQAALFENGFENMKKKNLNK